MLHKAKSKPRSPGKLDNSQKSLEKTSSSHRHVMKDLG